MSYSTMHQSIYECKMRFNTEIKLKPIEYSFPVEAEHSETKLICRVKATCTVDKLRELTCKLSFEILNIMNQTINGVQCDIQNPEMINMNERQLAEYIEKEIPLESIPLHRGVYSFKELALIIHSFILPAFSAKLEQTAEKDSAVKRITIAKLSNPRFLLQKEMKVLESTSAVAR